MFVVYIVCSLYVQVDMLSCFLLVILTCCTSVRVAGLLQVIANEYYVYNTLLMLLYVNSDCGMCVCICMYM